MKIKRKIITKAFVSVFTLAIFTLSLTLAIFSYNKSFAGGGGYPDAWANAPRGAIVDNWRMYNRECTSFVAWKLSTANGYNIVRKTDSSGRLLSWSANLWNIRSLELGARVDNKPAVGSVAWWSHGHVAWVSAVNSNGTVNIEEYNYNYSGNYNARTISRSNPTAYIHFRDLSAATTGSNNARNVFAIKRNGASGSTEIHAIDINDPRRFALQTVTVLHPTASQGWDFDMADYNGDGVLDLYAIKHSGTSGRTELHIVDGANPGRFLQQTATALHPTDSNGWSFAVGDYNRDGRPDIYAIKKNNTGTNSTEIHIINGANPNQFLLQTGSALHRTDTNWAFDVGDYNRDGVPDLYAIPKSNTGSRTTEVHILNGANFGQFLLHTGTALHMTDSNWDFRLADYNNDGVPDLYAINKRDLGSSSTAVHVLNGRNFGQFILQTGTGLHQTDLNWNFE